MGFLDLLKRITESGPRKPMPEPEKLHPIPLSGCDPLLRKAADFIMADGSADPYTLQLKLKIGYSHACALLSQLEEIGIIEHFGERNAGQGPECPHIECISPESSNYDLLVSKMDDWKRKYFVDNGSRTSERQKDTLQLILRDPDHDLYKLSAHGTTCSFCAPREGRVYSRSGTDPDFPPLALAFRKIDPNGPDVLWNTYLVTHPNTLHVLIAWTPAGRTPEELEEIKRFSNPATNPFSYDPRTPKQIDAYKKKMLGRKKWLRSYRLFEKCRELNIEKFPKTFQTFQKHKLANSEKYQEWMRQYSMIKNQK